MKAVQQITKPLEKAGVTPCRESRTELVAGSALQAAAARHDAPGRHAPPLRSNEATFSETLLGPREVAHGQAAAARHDAPGRHAPPLRSNEVTFSETLLGPREVAHGQGLTFGISRLESVASCAATLPPSRAPSRTLCPSTEGDCQPSDHAAHSPVEQLQGRWTDELTELRRASMRRTRKGRFAKMPEDPNGKDSFRRRATIGDTGLTFLPSDNSVVARTLPNSSSLPDVFVRTQGAAPAREDKQGALSLLELWEL